MAKFATNNKKSLFTKLFPFFATKALHPYMSFDKVKFFKTNTYKRVFN